MKKQIEVFTGQYHNGMWYASSCEVPWLAAEGSSYNEVVRVIGQIAPVIVAGAGVGSFKLAWRIATRQS